MKTNLFKVFSLTAIITFCFASSILAQTPEVEKAEAKIKEVLKDSGNAFKEGLLNLQDNRRSQAREKFDKSVEVFLMSNVNVRSNRQLAECYDKLVDTIYRIEFPTSQKPDVKYLSLTCGWDIKPELADSVNKMAQPAPSNTTTATNENDLVRSVVPNTPQISQNGFSEQKYEPSPLDELSKLELTKEEENVVNTVEGQQQYELIRAAVNNNSLGFKFQMDPRVQGFIAYYQGRGRVTMETGLSRSGMFMRMARRIFREEGIPENIAWLAQVESAWKPVALSWASASGLWQFIPGTGARYGLRRTAYLDERNSFEKATRASAQYLKFLANRYGGNWELGMAAYNCGEGNVDKAIRKAGANSYWAAYPYLPKETRDYVPNILAVILVANNPQKYGFGHVRPQAPLVYDSIRVPSSTSLSLLAQSSKTSVDYLRYLNPELRTNSTPPEPYVIRVPAGSGNEVAAVIRKIPGGNRGSAVITTAAVGENWQNVSNRTGVSVEQLQAANGTAAPKGNVVVPTGNNVRKTAQVYQTTPNVSSATPKLQVVKVKAGDTVAKIANRFGIAPVMLARHNGLSGIDSPLAVGRELKIPPR